MEANRLRDSDRFFVPVCGSSAASIFRLKTCAANATRKHHQLEKANNYIIGRAQKLQLPPMSVAGDGNVMA
jgi:hypothetical protein